MGDGTNLVDVTYVENAAAAHLQAADALGDASPALGESSIPTPEGDATIAQTTTSQATASTVPASPAGKAYFISQGEPVNCWQWIDEILALVDVPPVAKSLSFDMARRIGAGCEMIYRLLGLSGEPPMTRFLAAQLSMSHYFDISTARRDFGYEPRVSTEEGMQRLAEWLRGKS